MMDGDEYYGDSDIGGSKMMNGDVYDDDSVDDNDGDKDDKMIDYDDNDYNEVMCCSLIFSTTYYGTIYITPLTWQTELSSVLVTH